MSHDERCSEPLAFPAAITNRPALPRIGYRIGGYGEIREALLRWRDLSPELAGWTHRGAEDPGVALLEGAAILGDILTLYQDLYANECFLRTATWRDSIAELVRLTGYRLAPAIGGRAVFAARVLGAAPVTIPAGFAITAPLEGLTTTPTFETTSELVAHAWLNEVPLFAEGSLPAMRSSTTTLIANGDVELRRGDRLLFGTWHAGGYLESIAIVVVTATRTELGRTIIELRGALPSGLPRSTTAYRLGRTFRHLGHNAPASFMGTDPEGDAVRRTTLFERDGDGPTAGTVVHAGLLAETISSLIGVLIELAAYIARFPGAIFDTGLTEQVVFLRDALGALGDLAARIPREPYRDLAAPLAATELPLDTQVSDLVAGSDVLCVTGEVSYHRTIERVANRSMSWGPVTAAVTVLTVDEDFDGSAGLPYDIRSFEIHTILDELVVTGAPRAATGTSTTVTCFGTGDEATLLLDRACLLVAPDGGAPVEVHVTSVDAADPETARLREIELDAEVALASGAWNEPVARLAGNLVAATEGASQPELKLGNGDARQTWQTFRLPKAPLTYLRDPVHGRAPELTLYVDGRAWRRVESFLEAGPGDEVYVVREDERGDSFVQAGDGTTGRRFPSGVDNIVARYRTGSGSFGPLREGASARGAKRLPHLDRFDLRGEATGGEAAESFEVARRAAPASTQTLGRLVSLADYEAEALSLPGVEEALARWDEDGGVPSIIVTVLMTRGRSAEIDAVREALLATERCRGARRHPVIVRAGAAEYVYLRLSIATEAGVRREAIEASVTAALGVGSATDGVFGAETRRFGAPEYASRVLGIVQNVTGVRWATVDAFGSLGVAAELDALGLPASLTVAPMIACPADHVLRLDSNEAVEAFALAFVDGVHVECAP